MIYGIVASQVRGTVTQPPAITFSSLVSALFGAGEQGAAIDPLDMSTLYQDSEGDIAAAQGQSVGLALDTSQALARGPERIGPVAGSVTFTMTGDGTYSVAGESATLNANTSGAGSYCNYDLGTLTLGVLYEISIKSDNPNVSIMLRRSGSGSNQGTLDPVDGHYRILYMPGTGVSHGIRCIVNNNGESATFTEATAKVVMGNHAIQRNATLRPVLNTHLDYDSVDDVLDILFQASLGESCTIARAVPGVGAQILTAQTVGTSFTDNADHIGLIVLNRALTPEETADVTSLFNQRAGV